MKILICVDDTDDVTKETSTGKIADKIKDALAAEGAQVVQGITRHQLLLSDEIEYTSHNSSMCMELQTDLAMEEIRTIAERELKKEMSPVSDPGLCFCVLEELRRPERLIAYGKRAQREVISKDEADALAEEIGGTSLFEYGGSGIGVIGALAGCGLRLYGSDGTFRGGKGSEYAGMTLTVGEWKERIGVQQVTDLSGTHFDGENIQSSVFENRKNVKEIIFSDAVTHFGKKAFAGCSNLRTFTVPESVTYRESDNRAGIGESCFASCPKLERMIMMGMSWPGFDGTFPSSVKTIYVPTMLLASYKADAPSQADLMQPQVRVSIEFAAGDGTSGGGTAGDGTSGGSTAGDGTSGGSAAGDGTTEDGTAKAEIEVFGTVKPELKIFSVIGDDLPVKWEVRASDNTGDNDPAAVSVSEDGTVTGLKYGTSVIRATVCAGTVNECSARCIVSVKRPPAVTLTAKQNTYNSNSLSWTAMDGADGYQILRSDSENGSYKVLENVEADVLSYVDQTAEQNVTYWYRVAGFKKAGDDMIYGDYASASVKTSYTNGYNPSLDADRITPKTASANAAKVNSTLLAQVRSSGITTACSISKKTMKIKFSAVKNAKNYRILYRRKGASKWSSRWTAGKTTATISKMTAKGLYEFKISAFAKKSGIWVKSKDSSVSRLYFGTVSGVKVKPGKKKMTVSWRSVKGTTGYIVSYTTDSKFKKSIKTRTIKGAAKKKLTVRNLKKGKTYYVKVTPYVKKGSTYRGQPSAVKKAIVK